ncbi:hypothetical protein [Neobacillus sp. NPDC093127]|uniref:hypothetical protein n=1 Tax=Neobacillus sp. NPDC093127 TaxID=3364296 RepID=UPI0037FF7061
MNINKIIAGAYEGQKIKVLKGRMFIGDFHINKETVERYEIMTEDSSTTSTTKGNTKKSMIGAGTKGAVGAVIGTAIAPGIGTLIGAGAGVTTAKGKNKSITKEVTSKEMLVAIYFSNGQESLVKMDGQYYEVFLRGTFSEPVVYKTKEKHSKDPVKNNQVLKVLGWIFVPYIMTPVFWKKLNNPYRILGTIWAVMALMIGIFGR